MSRAQADDRVRVPFVLGTTGHRNLDPRDKSELRETVRAELTGLLDELPNTPVLLLTCLADGADRLVAEVGLELGSERLRILPVLPMPQAEYRNDFDELSREEFDALLPRCASPVVMPPERASEWSEAAAEMLAASPTLRDAQYLAAGTWIVRHSSLLLALWDGQPAEGAGGTAQIVDAMRLGLASDGARVTLDPADVGPVVHVWARREAGSQPSGDALRRLLPELLLTSRSDSQGQHRHQSRTRILERVGAEQLERANAELANLPPAPPGEAGVPRSPYDHAHVGFDQLAQHTRADRSSLLWKVQAPGMLALFMLGLYDFVLSRGDLAESPISLLPIALNIALMSFAFRSYRRGVEQRTDTRRADYRALAESLRVQRCWWLAGLSDRVADNYLLRQQPSETLWLRLALRALDVEAASEAPPAGDAECLRAGCEQWIGEQHLFFARMSRAELRRASRSRSSTRSCVRFAVASLGALVLLHLGILLQAQQWLVMPDVIRSSFDTLSDALLLAAGGFTLLATLSSKFLERGFSATNAQNYSWGEQRFGHASERLAEMFRCGETSRAQALVRQLGRLALEENALWLLAHRTHPVEAPELT